MIRSGIEGLLEFGTHEHSLMGNIRNVGLAFLVMLIWTIVVTVMLTTMAGVGTNEIRALLSAKMSIYSAALAALPAGPKMSVFMAFFLSCIFAPLWEEFAFRYIPLRLAKSQEIMFVRGFSHKVRHDYGVEYDHNRRLLYGNLKGTGFILPVMLLSSVIFGVVHGNVINIMFQGVGGFIFAWLMIKGGYWPAVMAHVTWNFMLMFGMPTVLGL